MTERVCVAGAGVIGSLFAGHLAQVAEVSVLARREEHARALNEEGIRVSGRSDLHGRVVASTDPAALPEPELVLVCCKGTDLEPIAARLAGHFAGRDRDDGAERPRRRRDRRRATATGRSSRRSRS